MTRIKPFHFGPHYPDVLRDLFVIEEGLRALTERLEGILDRNQDALGALAAQPQAGECVQDEPPGVK